MNKGIKKNHDNVKKIEAKERNEYYSKLTIEEKIDRLNKGNHRALNQRIKFAYELFSQLTTRKKSSISSQEACDEILNKIGIKLDKSNIWNNPEFVCIP